MYRRRFAFAAVAAAIAAPALAQTGGSRPLTSAKASYRLATLTTGLVQPWGMAFLPDGRMLVTERPGRLRIFADGRLRRAAVPGVPEVFASGQGGLLDICLHPGFAQNRILYLSYSGSGPNGAATTVARAEFTEAGLRDVTPVFVALPYASGSLHFGSRIAFDRAGFMYVTTGERYQMRRAQDLADLGGKVVRLHDDGKVPADNPFVGRAGARPEIFTWGHRNPQGLTVHPETGRVWLAEHGPKGGDEINVLKAGAN